MLNSIFGWFASAGLELHPNPASTSITNKQPISLFVNLQFVLLVPAPLTGHPACPFCGVCRSTHPRGALGDAWQGERAVSQASDSLRFKRRVSLFTEG